MKIYIAAPLFNEIERDRNLYFKKIISNLGFVTYLDHTLLKGFIRSKIEDLQLVLLIQKILSLKDKNGLLAGNPLATYLANKFLFIIDKQLIDNPIIRFHDDFFFFSRNTHTCEDFITLIGILLSKLYLKINPEKTWIRLNPNIKVILT